MNESDQSERKIAVTTNWGFFGSFGLCLVLSGFYAPNLIAGLFGFTLVIFGFVSHVIINHIFHAHFSDGEVALGFSVYAVSLLIFVVSWIAAPHFSSVNIAIGLSGFAALSVCFVFYMVATHGVRGTIEQLDVLRKL